jgi:hypothetical protein
VLGADVVVAELARRLFAGLSERVPGRGRPAARPAALLGRRGAIAFLGRLLAGTEQLADLGPGQLGGTGVGDAGGLTASSRKSASPMPSSIRCTQVRSVKAASAWPSSADTCTTLRPWSNHGLPHVCRRTCGGTHSSQASR